MHPTRQFLTVTGRGYVVTAGLSGPGSAAPSPEKLEELIGTTTPFESDVEFGPTKGLLSFIGLLAMKRPFAT